MNLGVEIIAAFAVVIAVVWLGFHLFALRTLTAAAIRYQELVDLSTRRHIILGALLQAPLLRAAEHIGVTRAVYRLRRQVAPACVNQNDMDAWLHHSASLSRGVIWLCASIDAHNDAVSSSSVRDNVRRIKEIELDLAQATASLEQAREQLHGPLMLALLNWMPSKIATRAAGLVPQDDNFRDLDLQLVVVSAEEDRYAA